MPSRDKLQIDPRYRALALIFNSRRPSAALEWFTTLPDTEYVEWVGLDVRALLLTAGEHQEPLIEFHDRIRSAYTVQELRYDFIAEILRDATARDDAPLTSIAIDTSSGALSDINVPNGTRVFIHIAQGQIVQIGLRVAAAPIPHHSKRRTGPAKRTRDVLGTPSAFPLVLKRLALQSRGKSTTIAKQLTGNRSPYEPYAAYVREVARSQVARLSARIAGLLDVLNSGERRSRVASFAQHYDYLLYLQRDLHAFQQGTQSQLVDMVQFAGAGPNARLETPVDRLAQWLRFLHRQVGLLENAVTQHRVPHAETLLAGALPLNAIQRVIDTCFDLSTLKKTSHPVATFALEVELETLGVADRSLHTMLSAQAKWGFPGPAEAPVIKYPRYFDMRAGALPLLARPAAQSIFEDCLDGGQQAADEFFAVKRFVSQFLPKRLYDRDASQEWRIEKPDNLKMIMSPMRTPLRALAYDALATLLMGPAYFYALLRFSLGSFYELFFGRPVMPLAHGVMVYTPTLRDRLAVCLRCLEVLNIPCRFRFTENDYSTDERIDIAILETPFKLYDSGAHGRAVNEVKPQLQRNQFPEAQPREVLNALWDGVVKREAFVNEAAAYLSIALPKADASRTVAGERKGRTTPLPVTRRKGAFKRRRRTEFDSIG